MKCCKKRNDDFCRIYHNVINLVIDEFSNILLAGYRWWVFLQLVTTPNAIEKLFIDVTSLYRWWTEWP
jgi:hypothetical protein